MRCPSKNGIFHFVATVLPPGRGLGIRVYYLQTEIPAEILFELGWHVLLTAHKDGWVLRTFNIYSFSELKTQQAVPSLSTSPFISDTLKYFINCIDVPECFLHLSDYIFGW
jgi:hypothetical protein